MKGKCSNHIKSESPCEIKTKDSNELANEILNCYKGFDCIETPVNLIKDNYAINQVDRIREPHLFNHTLVEKLILHYEDKFHNQYKCEIIIK